MSENTGKTELTYLGMWIVVIQMIAILVLVPNSWLIDVAERESSWLQEDFGKKTSEHIIRQGRNWYESSFVDSGFNDTVREVFFGSEENRLKAKGFENFGQRTWFPWLEKRGYSITVLLHLMFERLSQLVLWLPFFILMILSAAWDGYMSWKRKTYSFEYASPWFHRFSIKTLRLMVLALLIIVFLPMPLPPMLLPLVVLGLVPILTISLISNLPKKI